MPLMRPSARPTAPRPAWATMQEGKYTRTERLTPHKSRRSVGARVGDPDGDDPVIRRNFAA